MKKIILLLSTLCFSLFSPYLFADEQTEAMADTAEAQESTQDKKLLKLEKKKAQQEALQERKQKAKEMRKQRKETAKENREQRKEKMKENLKQRKDNAKNARQERKEGSQATREELQKKKLLIEDEATTESE